MKKLILALALVVSMSAYASATSIDLTTEDSGNIGGVGFVFSKEQPAGTGFLNTFLRIEDKQKLGTPGVEEGYNTDADNSALPLDVHPNSNSLLFSTLRPNGLFYEFVLDINESNNESDNLLSLDGLMLFRTTAANRAQNGTTVIGSLLYDMDAIEPSTVLLDADREGKPGSGATDMLLRVPASLLTPAPGEDYYLILWSQFGLQGGGAAAGSGFEEWAVRVYEDGNPPIPEPGTILLLGAGFAGLALYRRCQSHK